MDNETYLAESSRSVAPGIHTEFTELEGTLIKKALMDTITAGDYCDSLKRKLFYGLEFTGKGLPSNTMSLEKIEGQAIAEHLRQFISHYAVSNITPNDLIHGIIGAAGETGELVDALTSSLLKQGPIDTVNVGEEVGDVLWYLALILRSVNSTFEEAMELNIEKLRKRYPDKWSQKAVLDRDLDGEREILEKSKTV